MMTTQEQHKYIKYLENEVDRLSSLLSSAIHRDLIPRLNTCRVYRLPLTKKRPPRIL